MIEKVGNYTYLVALPTGLVSVYCRDARDLDGLLSAWREAHNASR